MDHLAIAKLLDTHRPQIVDQTVALALQNPFWVERFGPGIGERLGLDFDLNLAALAKSIRYRSPMIIDDHVRWRRGQIIGFGCSTGHIHEMFGHKWTAINSLMPPETLPTIYDYILSSMSGLAYPGAAPREAAQAHEALAEALTAASFDMVWHWQAAYGPDGRARAAQDNWFLFSYAIDALGNGSDSILGKHLRARRDKWLAHGLSTVHMQQLLWLASQAAEQHLAPAAAGELRRVLEASNGFLTYESESCNALLAAQDQIVAETAERLIYAGVAAQPEQTAMDVGWCLAYLHDSMAARDPASLVGYTRWMQHYFSSQGLSDTPLRQSFSILADTVGRYLPQYATNEACSIISAAQRTL